MRVLFVGNSYTYYNNLAGMVESLSRAAGQPMEARAITRGGATLEQMYAWTQAREVLQSSRWDYVVLQEQSTLGLQLWNGDWSVNQPDAFHNWVRIWSHAIRQGGARPVLLNTWARKGRGEMQAHLDWAYSAIAKEIGAPLIPAGEAFRTSLAGAPEIELYEDGSHPSPAGSYLAACVTVHTLIGKGCDTAPDMVAGTPMDNAAARLREGEPGPIVSIAPAAAARLRGFAMAAVHTLTASGGYWSMPKPEYREASLGTAAENTPAEQMEGTWRGITWVYGKRADIVLNVHFEDGKCSGTWSISAAEPPTQTTLPLERCRCAEDGGLHFRVGTLFQTSELHQARLSAGALKGTVEVESRTPYHRQMGTWELFRFNR
jgi:hypothetical protein